MSVFMLMRMHLQQKRSDFMEMILHHSVTVALIWFSYISDCIKIGSVVLFIHYLADVTTSGVKMCCETTFNTGFLCFGIPNHVLWPYSRIYVFSDLIINAVYKLPPTLLQSIEREDDR